MPVSEYIANIRRKIGHDPLLLPGVTALVFNEHGEVLLQLSADDSKWHTLGGMLEPGEEPAHAVVREVKEETGLDVIPERIVSVRAWPEVMYSNGDICHFISTAFRCRITGGELRVADAESLEFRFYPIDALPPLRDIERDVILDGARDELAAKFKP